MSTITWDNANFTWNNNPFTWDEVVLIQETIQEAAGADGKILEDLPWMRWEDDEKKKKLIKLVLKVHGNTITESKQKEIKQYKIKASDIKITAEKVLGVEVLTENIKF